MALTVRDRAASPYRCSCPNWFSKPSTWVTTRPSQDGFPSCEAWCTTNFQRDEDTLRELFRFFCSLILKAERHG